MTKTEKIFKDNLVRLREEKGISKYAVAKETDIDVSYYNKLENQQKETLPRYAILEKIAHFYDIKVYVLFKEVKKKPPIQ